MGRNANPRDHVILTSHVVSTSFPASVALAAHTPPVSGLPGGCLWSGLAGTESAQRALHLAQRKADALQSHCLTVRTWVTLRDLEVNRGRMTRSQALHTGFLHLDRIKSEFRDELHKHVLERLASCVPKSQMGQLLTLKFSELMTRFPRASGFLLEAHPTIALVVHPAYLVGGDDRPVWVGTIRRQDLTHYRSETLYLEESCLVF